MNVNSMLLIDFYKAVHAEMLPKGITKSVSYFTPRMSRVEMWNKVVNFGIQSFCKEFLIRHFNENFFSVPEEEVMAQYHHVMDNALGVGVYDDAKIRKLHKLGYLPIEIYALPEGAKVPMHVPMLAISNTHPDFAWLPQSLESLMSAELWHPMVVATVAKTYREIVDFYYDWTCDDDVSRARALGNFDFRGDHGLDAAVKTGAAWLTSFLNTATVPAIPWLEENYNCDCSVDKVGYGSPSTEHAVMCSNFAVDGDEITLLRRLLTEIYPHTSFSCVMDSYDYWHVVKDILPQLKDEIMNHDGCLLVRGDSGDCVKVVTDTVFALWDIFGGTVNSKGFKVLDPHVKALYGDSITIDAINQIYEILKDHGFACSNVSLGVGSFSMHCIVEDGKLLPFTRDTFSMCVKATYCEIDGKPYPIFKDPKDGGFKTSQKGCCIVERNLMGVYTYTDGHTWKEAVNFDDNQLQQVYWNGMMTKEYTLDDVRNNLHDGHFYD